MITPTNHRKAIVAATTAFVAAILSASSVAGIKPSLRHSFRPQDMITAMPSYTYVYMNPINRADKPKRGFEGEDQEDYKEIKVEIELTSLGYYYITSYCPYECGGSWQTASGATCHRADWEDRIMEPTTCAVDLKLHSISGDTYFYIEAFDRVFVAEDTGSAVKGKHLDLFYEDYDDVLSFPTGYYEVFAVEYVYTEIEYEDLLKPAYKEFRSI